MPLLCDSPAEAGLQLTPVELCTGGGSGGIVSVGRMQGGRVDAAGKSHKGRPGGDTAGGCGSCACCGRGAVLCRGRGGLALWLVAAAVGFGIGRIVAL